MKDNLLDATYEIITINARKFSQRLKTTYENLGIDISEHNSVGGNLYSNDKGDTPIEAYAYQLFFAYKKDGEYYLLDGYRRLLWAENIPNIDINVHVYENLNDQQLINLMMYLNHWKFSSTNKFWDRGFSLFYKTYFDINISSINDAFMGYLLVNKANVEYSFDLRVYYNQKTNQLIKEKMLEADYLNNIRLIDYAVKKYKGLNNVQFGALISKFKDYCISISELENFLSQDRVDKICSDLHEMNSDNGIIKRMNKFHDYFKEYILSLKGIEVKTYQSAVEECKEIQKQLKKEGYKSLTHHFNKIYYNDKIEMINNIDQYDLVALIMPDKKTFEKTPFYGKTYQVGFKYVEGRLGTKHPNLTINGVECETGFENWHRTYPMKKVKLNGVIYNVKTSFKIKES